MAACWDLIFSTFPLHFPPPQPPLLSALYITSAFVLLSLLDGTLFFLSLSLSFGYLTTSIDPTPV